MIFGCVAGALLCVAVLLDARDATRIIMLPCFGPPVVLCLGLFFWTFYKIEVDAQGITRTNIWRRRTRLGWAEIERVTGSVTNEDVTLVANSRKVKLDAQTSGYLELVGLVVHFRPDLFWTPGKTRVFRRSYTVEGLWLVLLGLPTTAAFVAAAVLEPDQWQSLWAIAFAVLMVGFGLGYPLWSAIRGPVALTVSMTDILIEYRTQAIRLFAQDIQHMLVESGEQNGTVFLAPVLRMRDGHKVNLSRKFCDGNTILLGVLRCWEAYHSATSNLHDWSATQ